ncbi:MAG TPA: TetR/AcrR family transcriptional regulator [Candidatus Binatia bacterium]|nr:TetR/AcrR family transcriptional regulator [Candidatus Binatia bacterium]
MARPKEFDAEKVLASAAEVFWRQGYDVVSIQDLEAATGLGRGSLYNAFGDKEGLFIAALDRYLDKFGAVPLRHLAEADVGKGIRLMLEAIIARMSDPANPRGCLLTNSSLAFGTGSSRIDAHVAGKVQAMEEALQTAIVRARREGQIPASVDPKALARFYAAVAQSLGVMHRANGDAAALRDIAAVALRCWPAKPKAGRAKVSRIPGRRRR